MSAIRRTGVRRSGLGRTGVAVAVLAVVAGAAGCQGGDENAAWVPAATGKLQSREAATKTLKAAYERTAEAKSAKVSMKMSMPAGIQGAEVGDMRISGVMGWDPALMDMTVEGDAFEAEPDGPQKMRMVMRDDVMYMDMGAAAAAEMDGKRWMKMDLGAIAEQAGDEELKKQMTGGLENMNQDPAQQLALLLDSPNLKHVGPQKVNGVDTQHYKGSLTLQEMIDANKSLVLSDEERKAVLEGAEKAGVEGYDVEVWVDEKGYPSRMDVGIDSSQGEISLVTDYTDYGAKAEVEAPPASDTVDLMEMLGDLEGALQEGADASADPAV